QAPTQELREPVFWTNVYDALYLMRRRTAHEIIDVGSDEPWRKRILKSSYPMLKAQSRRNLNGTRQGKVQEPPPDERDLRPKAAAKQLIQAMLPLIEAGQNALSRAAQGVA